MVKSVFSKHTDEKDIYKQFQKIETDLWKMNKKQLEQQKRLTKTHEERNVVIDVIDEKYRDNKLKKKMR